MNNFRRDSFSVGDRVVWANLPATVIAVARWSDLTLELLEGSGPNRYGLVWRAGDQVQVPTCEVQRG